MKSSVSSVSGSSSNEVLHSKDPSLTSHSASYSLALMTRYIPLLSPSHTSSPSAVISHRTSQPRCRSLSHRGARGCSSSSPEVAPAHHAETS